MKETKITKPLMTTSHILNEDEASPCTVIYVNQKKGYYQVIFDDCGVKECYKFINFNDLEEFKKNYQKAFGKKPVGVYVYESGILYSSIVDCAKDIGVLPATISKHIHGETSNVKGYHIYIL